jgi:hypothetical protein
MRGSPALTLELNSDGVALASFDELPDWDDLKTHASRVSQLSRLNLNHRTRQRQARQRRYEGILSIHQVMHMQVADELHVLFVYSHLPLRALLLSESVVLCGPIAIDQAL